jgi:small subunit ribosomal protein S2
MAETTTVTTAVPDLPPPAHNASGMPLPVRTLLEAGVHFGHQTKRWNPKMRPFIYGARNGVHIIDLDQTAKLFKRAFDFITETVG